MKRAVLLFLAACGGSASTSDASMPDASTPDVTTVDTSMPVLDVWPNEVSFANSDPWISENHTRIREMHPRVLALNFVNGRSNAEMETLYQTIIDGFEEGSRPHASGPPFLFYSIAKSIDLTDKPPPPNYQLKNSTKYPRKSQSSTDQWHFDYKALFNATFASYYDIHDPNDNHTLDLCELFERGIVHEVWIYGDADVPDVSAAEVLTNRQAYDQDDHPIAGKFDRCGGNGCFDLADVPKCGRTVRIGWVNNTRGPGCYLHSLGHDFERMGNGTSLPVLKKWFAHFGNFDFKTRGYPFGSFYDTCSMDNCVSYPDMDSAIVNGTMVKPLDQGCGNVHFPANARQHYDYDNTQAVTSTCEHFGLRDDNGKDAKDVYTAAKVSAYEMKWGDCGGGWQVYWRQNFPGYQTKAVDADNLPMKNWWPYLYY